MSKQKRKTIRHILIGCLILFILLTLLLLCTGCTPADKINKEISDKADNFGAERRIIVSNIRTDTVILELIGTFSLNNNTSTNELEITCKLADDVYYKHFIELQDEISYFVEDISYANLDKYHYEFNPYPTEIRTFTARWDDR